MGLTCKILNPLKLRLLTNTNIYLSMFWKRKDIDLFFLFCVSIKDLVDLLAGTSSHRCRLLVLYNTVGSFLAKLLILSMDPLLKLHEFGLLHFSSLNSSKKLTPYWCCTSMPTEWAHRLRMPQI